eukprot:9476109-Ditylum_brightwellii.AAC.1
MDHLNGAQNTKAQHIPTREKNMFGGKSTSAIGSIMAFICRLCMIMLPGMRLSRRMSQNKRKSMEKAKTISRTCQMILWRTLMDKAMHKSWFSRTT